MSAERIGTLWNLQPSMVYPRGCWVLETERGGYGERGVSADDDPSLEVRADGLPGFVADWLDRRLSPGWTAERSGQPYCWRLWRGAA